MAPFYLKKTTLYIVHANLRLFADDTSFTIRSCLHDVRLAVPTGRGVLVQGGSVK